MKVTEMESAISTVNNQILSITCHYTEFFVTLINPTIFLTQHVNKIYPLTVEPIS